MTTILNLGAYEDQDRHVVLDDKHAEAIRSSFVYQARTSEYLPFVCSTIVVGSLTLIFIVMTMFRSFELDLEIATTVDRSVVFVLLAGLVAYIVSGELALNDDLEPIESAFAFRHLNDIALEHEEVAGFITDALAKGKTLRSRDFEAAIRIRAERRKHEVESAEKSELEQAVADLKTTCSEPGRS